MKIPFLITSLSIISFTSATAEVSMPSFFSDGMVLQQKSTTLLWGWAESGEKVSVNFLNQNTTATTNTDGKWSIELKNLQASDQGKDLTIKVGDDTKVIKDVLVGEVWIASGQSNMEWTILKTKDTKTYNTAKDNLLRVYVSKNLATSEELKDFPGNWLATKPGNTQNFTGVGYHFARSLREKLNVPVGIIECAWGGKRIEPFISDTSMKQAKDLQYLVQIKEKEVKNYTPEDAKKQFDKAMENWTKKNENWQKTKTGPRPRKPKMRIPPLERPTLHSTIYNGMIAPIAGYSAKGIIWYQGESNAGDQSANDYGKLLKLLIKDWSKQWGTDLSCYYVQLANYGDFKREGWLVIQDEMRRLLDDPEMSNSNIGMAVINDIGAIKNIHPSNKKDVGDRLARWALSKDYGIKDTVISGPLYKNHQIKGSTIEIEFAHSKGLKTRDNQSPGAFELLDSNNKWLPAKAEIKNGLIIVSHDKIESPTQVRYAWHVTAQGANLVNAEGLPTSCFTTKR